MNANKNINTRLLKIHFGGWAARLRATRDAEHRTPQAAVLGVRNEMERFIQTLAARRNEAFCSAWPQHRNELRLSQDEVEKLQPALQEMVAMLRRRRRVDWRTSQENIDGVDNRLRELIARLAGDV